MCLFFNLDKYWVLREFVIVGVVMDNFVVCCIVYFLVFFMLVLLRILFIKKLSFLLDWSFFLVKMMLEILMRYDFNFVLFYFVNVVVSLLFVNLLMVFNMLYVLEMSCMSSYSMSLCIILIKFSAFFGLMYVMYVFELVCVFMGFKILVMILYVFLDLFGIMDGLLCAFFSFSFTFMSTYSNFFFVVFFDCCLVFLYYLFLLLMM